MLCIKDDTNVVCITCKAGATIVFKCCDKIFAKLLTFNHLFPL